MKNGLFQISIGDVWRGLIMAIMAPLAVSIFAVVGAIINAPGFDVFSVDWALVGRNLANVIVVTSYGAASGYILKNLLTDNQGNVLAIGSK